MEILEAEKKGKSTIKVSDLNLGGLFVALAKEEALDFNKIKTIAFSLDIEIFAFLKTPNFIEGDSEIAFIDGGFMGDIIILYSNYFISCGTTEILSYYPTISPIIGAKVNSFDSTYFDVKFASEDKKTLKKIVKESKINNKETLKIQEEQVSDAQKNEMLSKLKNCIITTTPSLDGYKVSDYYGTVSGFSILKLDIFQDIAANFGDFFGGKSKGFAKKFQDLQNDVEDKLKFMSISKGGNAVIGTSFDVEFIETATGEKRMLGMSDADIIERKLLVSGSGTSVCIVKLN